MTEYEVWTFAADPDAPACRGLVGSFPMYEQAVGEAERHRTEGREAVVTQDGEEVYRAPAPSSSLPPYRGNAWADFLHTRNA